VCLCLCQYICNFVESSKVLAIYLFSVLTYLLTYLLTRRWRLLSLSAADAVLLLMKMLSVDLPGFRIGFYTITCLLIVAMLVRKSDANRTLCAIVRVAPLNDRSFAQPSPDHTER